jgi:phage replication initiation protein
MAVDRARFRMAVVGGAGGFSPLSPGEKRQRAAAEIGPGSNTGQKGQEDAIIDYLTLSTGISTSSRRC